jgi:ubiquitin-protein ligase
MSIGIKKLQDEHKFIKKSGVLANIGGTAGPINKDYLHWKGCFIGPKDTPYMGGLFYIEFKLKDDYPNSGPIDVQMRTKTYHPNIWCQNGHICDSYFTEWKNTNNIVGIINTVFDLLSEKNPGNGYHEHDKQKAINFTSLYAYENQNYDWNNSWGKGWEE